MTKAVSASTSAGDAPQAILLPESIESQNIRAKSDTAIALAGLLLILALQLPLVWQRSIHWDEFFYYSQVQDLARGTLSMPLQTLHTRLFSWLIKLPGSAIDHIIAARFVMMICEIVTAAAITGIAARFTNRATGLVCASAYLSAGYVFQHGFSFRTDPQATALLMSALWIVLTRKLNPAMIILVGALVGVAAMVTIKVILYAPAFAGVAWLHWNENDRTRKSLIRLAALGATSATVFALIYFSHKSGLPDSAAIAKRTVSTSLTDMFVYGVPPYIGYAITFAIHAPVTVVALAAAPFAIFHLGFSKPERIAQLGLLAPSLSILFYHNTAPYFYVYMTAPVVAGSAAAFYLALSHVRSFVLVSLLAFNATTVWKDETSRPINVQRELISAAQTMIPKGTAYFDFCGMLGNFPKADSYMTPWGVKLYKRGNLPSYEHIMAKSTVPIFVENDPMVTRLLRTGGPVPEFLPRDAALLRDTFVHLWGPFWIAGRILPARTPEAPFTVHVPGTYTVHGSGLILDGRALTDGQLVEIERGPHLLANNGLEPTRLVWGKNLEPPATDAPTEPFWTPF